MSRDAFYIRPKAAINKELDRLENREKTLQTDIDSVKSEKEKLLSARNEILEMERLIPNVSAKSSAGTLRDFNSVKTISFAI